MKTKVEKMSSKEKLIAYIKAVRSGSRNAEIEYSTGFKSVNKVFHSSKTYTRNPKHKKFKFLSYSYLKFGN